MGEKTELAIVPCQGCNADIHFIVTERGKRMPCETKLIVTVTATGKTRWGYEPHWGYCPKAKDFKKERK